MSEGVDGWARELMICLLFVDTYSTVLASIETVA